MVQEWALPVWGVPAEEWQSTKREYTQVTKLQKSRGQDPNQSSDTQKLTVGGSGVGGLGVGGGGVGATLISVSCIKRDQ